MLNYQLIPHPCAQLLVWEWDYASISVLTSCKNLGRGWVGSSWKVPRANIMFPIQPQILHPNCSSHSLPGRSKWQLHPSGCSFSNLVDVHTLHPIYLKSCWLHFRVSSQPFLEPWSQALGTSQLGHCRRPPCSCPCLPAFPTSAPSMSWDPSVSPISE